MRLPQWLAYGLAPAVLVLGVAFQRYNVAVHDQTKWTGGGFGMFSTVDVPGARALRAYVVTDRGEALAVDPDYGTERRLVYTQPRQERLDAVARHLAAQDWRVYDASAYREIWPSLPDFLQRYFQGADAWQTAWTDSASTEGLYPGRLAFPARRAAYRSAPEEVTITGARVEVWKPSFDPDAEALSWTRIAAGAAQTEASE